MATFPKQALVEILQALDHTNDALWTDDGSPLVSEIQRLANDKTITRAQINEALPGFARKTETGITEPPDDELDAADIAAAAQTDPEIAAALNTEETRNDHVINEPLTEPDLEDVLGEAEADALADPVAERERLRLIAHGRVQAAEVAVAEAKASISAAQTHLRNQEARLSRTMQLYSQKYPPISAADNIKQHLAAQQALTYERVTGRKFEPNVAANPIDETMMDRRRDNGRNKARSANPAPYLPRQSAFQR